MNQVLPWKLIALVLGAFGVLLGALFLAGVAPPVAFKELIAGSLGSAAALSGTLRETTPLLILGAGVMLALRAGLFNIGAEGQFIIGAMGASVVTLQLGGALGLVLGILVGMLLGGLWALPVGLIRAYRGGHEVISSIMLNIIAIHLTVGMLDGPLKDPSQESLTTRVLASHSMLMPLWNKPPFVIHAALLVGILLVVGFALWLGRTVAGYELSATGANPTAAKLAGVHVPRVQVKAIFLSGAIAGLAGALQVVAHEGRFYDGFSPGYGFDALGVALLAGASPWALLPSALLFGALNKGSTSLLILGIPKGITGILLGLLILVFAAYRYRRAHVPR